MVGRDVDASGRPAHSHANSSGFCACPLAVRQNLRLSDVQVDQVLGEAAARFRRLRPQREKKRRQERRVGESLKLVVRKEPAPYARDCREGN